MADFTFQRGGKRYFYCTITCPTDGASVTAEVTDLPDDPTSPGFINPLCSLCATNEWATMHYHTFESWDPVTRTAVIRIYNMTPSGGPPGSQIGEFDFMVWFPHSEVR